MKGTHAGTQPSADIQPSSEDIAARPRAKNVGLALLAVLFCVLGLAMFGIFTSVRITMVYGPGWWAAAIAFAIVLTAALLWGWNRSQVANPTNRASTRMGPGGVIALLAGMSCISAEGILGGLPALAHHLTGRAGETVVTVAAKESSYQRYSCTHRLIIAEFTFGLRDYLCPSDRAFGRIDVGAKVRIEGSVSAFGVEPRAIYW